MEGTLVDSRCGAGRRGDLREPPVKGLDPVWSVGEGVVVGLRGKALWIRMGICAPTEGKVGYEQRRMDNKGKKETGEGSGGG